MGELFSLDAATKSAEYFHYHPSTGQFTIEDVQQVDDILAVNAARRAEKVSKKNTFRMVASVPENVYYHYEMLWKKQGMDSKERRKRWIKFLNDPDNRMFKTTDARI